MKSMMTDHGAENLSSISYCIATARGTDGSTFADRWSDELQGHVGIVGWLITASEQFTRAESTLNNEVPSYDWYLAVDDFVDSIIGADDLMSEDELFNLAGRSIRKWAN